MLPLLPKHTGGVDDVGINAEVQGMGEVLLMLKFCWSSGAEYLHHSCAATNKTEKNPTLRR